MTAMHRTRWTDTDDEWLIQGINAGKSYEEIGKELGRNSRSIKIRSYKIKDRITKSKSIIQPSLPQSAVVVQQEQLVIPLNDSVMEINLSIKYKRN